MTREEYFIVLYRKEIPCSLANGEKSRFQGVGIAIAEIEGEFVLLAPAYLSKTDDVSTVSPGALKRYSKCTGAMHEALEYFQITTQKGKVYKLATATVAGLDYVKLKLHHFKRPMKTKMERNPFLAVKPRLIYPGSGVKVNQQSASQQQSATQDQKSRTEARPRGRIPAKCSEQREAPMTRSRSKQAQAQTEIPKDPKSLHNALRMYQQRAASLASVEASSPSATKANKIQVAVNHVQQMSQESSETSTWNADFLCTQDPLVAALKVAKTANDRLALYLHVKFGHQNMDYIRRTKELGQIKGLPKHISDLRYDCPLCKIAAATKIPRGNLKDTTELRKGSRVHADWIIINVESCRGFKTALLITEATTRRKWGFATRTRSAPIQQMKYFVEHMRLQGYSLDELRIDEDGSLARSAEFMKLCVKELNMAVQTTGGYNSENNGMAESPIKPIKRMIRVFLVGASLPDILWCYAFSYAVYVLNHRYNRMIDNLPIVKWHDGNYELHSKDLFIFGSKVYIITKAEAKKQLQARTEKDPRDYIGLTIGEDELPQHVDGYFVGYASHSTVMLAYDPETNKIKRAHHAYVDEFNVRTLEDEKLTPNSVLLQDLPPCVMDEKGVVDPTKIKLVTCKFDESTHAVDPEQCVTIAVNLPPKGEPIGLNFLSDEIYGFPILANVDPTSSFRVQIPPDMHKNCWVIGINSKANGYIEPITAKYCMEEIKRCQKYRREVTIELTFCRKIKPINTDLRSYRAMTDQMDTNTPIVRHIVPMPIRPVAERSIYDCLKGPNRQHWKQALFHQYEKNAHMMLLSPPVPREKLPPDTKVFPSIIACRIKEKGEHLYKFEARHCLHGGSMQQGSDFDFSCAPTISHPILRVVAARTAIKQGKMTIVDVSNAFQNDVIPPEARLWIVAPILYPEFIDYMFPDLKYEKSPSGKYVLQTINGMQGRKDAGRSWYLLLRAIFEDFGLIPCPAEPALFVYYEDENELIVITSTDDFLCTYNDDLLFKRFTVHMEKYVPITTQDGPVMKYLNVRIIQTDQGVSIDQTHHIQTTILDKWFPADMTERLKSADTPYRTDSQFEKDIMEALPAQGAELARLEKEYGGKYNALIGQFLHVEQVTRFELGFAVTRLAQYNVVPNEPAFQALKRVARFLATHPHSPIFYPKLKLTMYQTIRFEYEPGKYDEHVIANLMQMYADADHARDSATRKSISCVLAAICGVLVHWVMAKQTCIAAHSTDAEIRAFYSATLMNRYLRVVLTYLRMDMEEPTTIWEDNQPAIDIMTAGQINGRVKHMAVPIKLIHEDIHAGNSKPKKIKGTLNLADIGTKPLPTSTLHRFWRFGRGQRFYPLAKSLHGTLMQVEMVNQRINEIENNKADTLIDYKASRLAAVYDGKGQT